MERCRSGKERDQDRPSKESILYSSSYLPTQSRSSPGSVEMPSRSRSVKPATAALDGLTSVTHQPTFQVEDEAERSVSVHQPSVTDQDEHLPSSIDSPSDEHEGRSRGRQPHNPGFRNHQHDEYTSRRSHTQHKDRSHHHRNQESHSPAPKRHSDQPSSCRRPNQDDGFTLDEGRLRASTYRTERAASLPRGSKRFRVYVEYSSRKGGGRVYHIGRDKDEGESWISLRKVEPATTYGSSRRYSDPSRGGKQSHSERVHRSRTDDDGTAKSKHRSEEGKSKKRSTDQKVYHRESVWDGRRDRQYTKGSNEETKSRDRNGHCRQHHHYRPDDPPDTQPTSRSRRPSSKSRPSGHPSRPRKSYSHRSRGRRITTTRTQQRSSLGVIL
jgi:hypothetical protein